SGSSETNGGPAAAGRASSDSKRIRSAARKGGMLGTAVSTVACCRGCVHSETSAASGRGHRDRLLHDPGQSVALDEDRGVVAVQRLVANLGPPFTDIEDESTVGAGAHALHRIVVEPELGHRVEIALAVGRGELLLHSAERLGAACWAAAGPERVRSNMIAHLRNATLLDSFARNHMPVARSSQGVCAFRHRNGGATRGCWRHRIAQHGGPRGAPASSILDTRLADTG